MTNRYHRFLDIPNYIPNIDYKTYWNNHKSTWTDSQIVDYDIENVNNNALLEWLDSLGLKIIWIHSFYTLPNTSGVIHSDNKSGQDWVKLIFQYSAKGSKMRWWSSDKKTRKINYGQKIMVAEEKDSKLEYQVDLSESNLINVGRLHSSYNLTDETRYVVSLPLYNLKNRRILWDEAVEKFSPYIV